MALVVEEVDNLGHCNTPIAYQDQEYSTMHLPIHYQDYDKSYYSQDPYQDSFLGYESVCGEVGMTSFDMSCPRLLRRWCHDSLLDLRSHIHMLWVRSRGIVL